MAEAGQEQALEQTQRLPIRLDTLFYRETDRAYQVAPHVHRIHQWYLLLHGGVDMELEGRTLHLGPGQSVIIPPLAVRAPRCRDRAPGYLVAIFECLAIDLAPVAGRILEMPQHLRDEALALAEELRAPGGPESRHLAIALLTRVLIGLKRADLARHPRSSPTHAVRHRELVEQAEAFLERNFYRTLTRAEVSRAVGLSEPHLGRLFRSGTGRSLLRRLGEIRIAHACSLLLESDLPITRIALDVGLNSFSHFSQAFKQATGLSPSDYRRARGRQNPG